jgi:predicted nucleic-acid-binding Zn-ribbon protein
MRTDNTGILTIILSGFFLLSLSCSPQSCIDETEALLKSSFYDYTTLEVSAPDSLTLHGMEADSLIYIKSASVKTGKFPLNPSSDNCVFIIKINGITDTIAFRYNSYPHLVSKECGYTFYHNLDTIPSHTMNIIDSISVTNNNITTANEENIQIFY